VARSGSGFHDPESHPALVVGFSVGVWTALVAILLFAHDVHTETLCRVGGDGLAIEASLLIARSALCAREKRVASSVRGLGRPKRAATRLGDAIWLPRTTHRQVMAPLRWSGEEICGSD